MVDAAEPSVVLFDDCAAVCRTDKTGPISRRVGRHQLQSFPRPEQPHSIDRHFWKVEYDRSTGQFERNREVEIIQAEIPNDDSPGPTVALGDTSVADAASDSTPSPPMANAPTSGSQPTTPRSNT